MKKIFLTVATLFLVACMQTLMAVPARSGWQTKTQPDGTTIEVQLMGDEFYHYWINRDGQTVQCDDNGFWQVLPEQSTPATVAAKRKAAAKKTSYQKIAKAPATGSPRGLVILVNFKDQTFQSVNNQSALHDMMNADNYTYNGATGSVAKYFADQSNGQYTPVFDVVGPVTLPYSMSHYGANDSEGNDILPGDMVVEACSIANALHNVDFTRYDNDYDGYLDFVYIIYAGKGEADGGTENTIWPHSWNVYSAEYFGNCSYNESKRMFDGRYIYQYACSGELDGPTGKRAGIGTIAHEFSHVIGMPDLYDTSYGQNRENAATPGAWHLMDRGNYNNDGKTPPSYTIYDKYYLGWLTPENPGNTAQVLTLNANEGYQLASSNSLLAATSTNTVYYIENRQNSGWDAALPGHGLLVWKIQYDADQWAKNTLNNGSPLRYALLSASGKTTQIGTAADPFPGTSNKTSWTTLSGKPLKDITEKNGVITLTYIEKPATEEPTDPEVNTNITGLQYADAYYYELEGIGYWEIDMYKGYDYDTYQYDYPELYVSIQANSKTALNGTYELLYAGYWTSVENSVEMDYDLPATITIQNTDNEGNYSVKGTFVGTDGLTYTFDDVVNVLAFDYDNWEEITLDESGNTTDPEDPTDPEEPTEPELTGTVTFDADVDMGNASLDATNQTPYTVSKSGVTLDVTKGIIGTYNNENHYRVYKNETLTITSTVGNIVKVEFTCTANNDEKYGPGCFTWSTGDYTYSGAVGTWTGNASEVAFTASSNQVRATQIVVTIAGLVTEVENIESATPTAKKILRNGQLLIIYNGKTYGVDGKEIGK